MLVLTAWVLAPARDLLPPKIFLRINWGLMARSAVLFSGNTDMLRKNYYQNILDIAKEINTEKYYTLVFKL